MPEYTLNANMPKALIQSMLTSVETLLFQKQWPVYWTEEERGTFASFWLTIQKRAM